MDLSSDTGRMVARILAAVARAEIERKAARQKRANLQRRQEGKFWRSGWRPYGYTNSGEVVPEEAELIREGVRLFLAGESLRGLARLWNKSGLKPQRAKEWDPTTIRDILSNPTIAGYVSYQGELTGEGEWDPLISPEDWGLVAARLESNARDAKGGRKGRKAENLLTGIATCAKCGQTIQAITLGKRQAGENAGENILGYSCRKHHLTTFRDEADRFVTEVISWVAHTLPAGAVFALPAPGQSLELLGEVEHVQEQLRELGDAFSTMRRVAFDAASARLQHNLQEAERALADASGEGDPRKLNTEAIYRFREAGLETQRGILSKVVKVTLHPKGRGRRKATIADQVEIDGKWLTLTETPYGCQRHARHSSHTGTLQPLPREGFI